MLRSLVAASMLALNTPPTQVDYQVCGAIHNGPLVPHVNPANLYPRRSDLA